MMPRRLRLTSLGSLAALGIAALSHAASAAIVVTLSSPGQEYPDFASLCAPGATCVYGTETFSGLSDTVSVGNTLSGNTSFVSTFTSGTNNLGGGATITGTYTGALTNHAGDQYGGSYNATTGTLNPYPDAYGLAAYSVALSSTDVPGLNYFGLWISAMDPTNELVLHSSDGSTFSFVSSNLESYISQASNGRAYYGNPNPAESGVQGADNGEPFAYVNFFDTTSYITQVDFTNTSGSGFESSNDAAGYYNPLNTGVGTLITSDVSIPEPTSAAALAIGLLALGFCRSRITGRADPG